MQTEKRKELIVSAIENGTVIDHVPTHAVYQVIKILGLEDYEDEVLIGNYLQSKKHGRKGIIKIKNKFFEKDEINKIALVAPQATLIVISNFDVIEKFEIETPDKIEKIVKCFNPNCITNCEQIESSFTVINKQELKLQCHYCEKTMSKNMLRFL